MERWVSWSDGEAWAASEAASSWASYGAAWDESGAASSSRSDVRGWGAGERRKERRHEQAAVRRAETNCSELSPDKWAMHREMQETYESQMMQYEAVSAQLKTELKAMARENEEAQQIAPKLQQTQMWLQEARNAVDWQKQEAAANHLRTVNAVNEIIQLRHDLVATLVERKRQDQLIANSETAMHTLTTEIAEPRISEEEQRRTFRSKVAEALEERAALQREVDRLTATVPDPRGAKRQHK